MASITCSPNTRSTGELLKVSALSRSEPARARQSCRAGIELEPRYLELELTQSLIMQDASGAISTMKALGIGLSIDDFGPGLDFADATDQILYSANLSFFDTHLTV